MKSEIHTFWLKHIHAFYINVRFIYAIAEALTTAIATIFLIGKGLSYAEIGVVWSVALFFSTVLDFPTGNFADLHGRKLAFVIGVSSVGVGNFVYGAGTALWMFFIASFFAGLGAAQISGSISSWMVDEQINVGKKDDINKIFGDGSAARSVGGIIGGILIGLFFAGPLEILYFISGVIFVLLGIFVFVSIPDNYGQPHGRWISLPKEVLSHYFHSFSLIVLSISLVLMFACFSVYFFILQPLAVEIGIQEGDLGYLYAIYMTGSAAGAFILGRISKKCGEIIILLFCFVMAAAGFFTISLNFGIVGLVCGMVQFSFGYGGSIPVLYAYTNTFIPSSIRASTSSLIGTIGTGGIIVLQILMGIFIELYGLVAASLCAVVFAAAGVCALLVLYKRS